MVSELSSVPSASSSNVKVLSTVPPTKLNVKSCDALGTVSFTTIICPVLGKPIALVFIEF